MAAITLTVFINNDGDLFAYGEAIAGFLPYVNCLLKKTGSPKRYKNLIGITLGTGSGGGIVCDGELFIRDNGVTVADWWDEAQEFTIKKDRPLPYPIDPGIKLSVTTRRNKASQ